MTHKLDTDAARAPDLCEANGGDKVADIEISLLTHESLNAFVKHAAPFTLLVFRGADLVSKAIRVLSKLNMGDDRFSHAGVLVTAECCPFVPNLQPGRLYVWESTFSYRVPGYKDTVPDVPSGRGRFGVQIRDLQDLLPLYCAAGAQVAYCPLLSNPWLPQQGEYWEDLGRRRAQLVATMSRVYQQHGAKHYEANCLQMLAAAVACCRPLRDGFHLKERMHDGISTLTNMSHAASGDATSQDGKDTCYVFCSEFVALVYQALGLLAPEFKAHEVLPTDFFGRDADGIPRLVGDPVYLTLP